MNTPKPPPPGSPGGRRKRPPTVIDLEATEVPEASTQATEPPAPQQQAEEARVAPDDVKASETAAEQVAFEPPPPEPPRPSDEPERLKSEQAAAPPARSAWMPQALAGVAGAAGGLLLVLLLWLSGMFSGGSDPNADLAPRLLAIEGQLKTLAERPAPPTIDPKAFDEIGARLGRLETAQARPRAPVTDPVVLGRITSAENALKSQADNLAAGSRREEALEAALRETNAKLDRLQAALGELQARTREAAAGSDRASRLAVAAAALRATVERGEPFAAELAVVKPFAPDADAIAALEPFAASGVPSASVFGQELAALVRPILRASGGAPREGSFLDKLQANAEKLVRIRPVDEAKGDNRSAALLRIEQRAAQGNLAGALAELGRLPPEARTPFNAWIAKAEARQKALDAGRKLAADAVAALKMSQ